MSLSAKRNDCLFDSNKKTCVLMIALKRYLLNDFSFFGP